MLLCPLIGQELPSRPTRFIVDPTRMFDFDRTERLLNVLERHASDNGTEVFVVIDRIPAGILPDDYARMLGEAWSGKAWAVIVYRPGMIGAPGLASGGADLERLKQENWEKQMNLLMDLSVQHWEEAENLDFLARRMAEMISFAGRLPSIASEVRANKLNEIRHDIVKIRERNKMILIVCVIVTFFILALLYIIIRGIRRRTRVWTFPEIEYHHRLGGRHAGGSDLCRSFPVPR
jgi:hypothetical protein